MRKNLFFKYKLYFNLCLGNQVTSRYTIQRLLKHITNFIIFYFLLVR